MKPAEPLGGGGGGATTGDNLVADCRRVCSASCDRRVNSNSNNSDNSGGSSYTIYYTSRRNIAQTARGHHWTESASRTGRVIVVTGLCLRVFFFGLKLDGHRRSATGEEEAIRVIYRSLSRVILRGRVNDRYYGSGHRSIESNLSR